MRLQAGVELLLIGGDEFRLLGAAVIIYSQREHEGRDENTI